MKKIPSFLARVAGNDSACGQARSPERAYYSTVESEERETSVTVQYSTCPVWGMRDLVRENMRPRFGCFLWLRVAMTLGH